jgi:lariat debranching enzyme
MSGIYNASHYTSGHYEVTPYNDNHKRSVYHVRHYDIYKMLQVKEAMDVFLSHDWPLGIEQYGDTRALLRAKKHFAREVNEL